MKGLDISISLFPVTGLTALYANPKSKPLELEKYLYVEKGKLGKRISISWKDLESTNSQG